MMDIIRLLFLTQDPNAAEAVIARIRQRGHAVRAQSCTDDEGLAGAIEALRPEVLAVVADEGIAHGAFGNANPSDSARSNAEAWLDRHSQAGRLPPIVWITAADDETTLDLLDAGIFAVCSPGQPDLIALYVTRAAAHAKNLAALRRMEQAIQQGDERCRLLLNHSRDAIAYIHEGLHLYANAAWLERFEIDDPEEALTLTLMDVVDREYRDALKTFLRAAEAGERDRTQLTFRTLKGTTFSSELVVSAAHWQGERCLQVVLLSAETAQLDENEQLANLDPLTGLFSRRHFLTQLQRVIAEAGNDDGAPFCMLLLAIDGIDHHVSQLGVARADDLITACAHRLRDALPKTALAAHLEGETFGVLLPGHRRSEAEPTLQALHSATNDAVLDLDGASVQITTSAVGVAGGAFSEGADELLLRAMRDLADLQRGGGERARFVTHSPRDTRSGGNDALWKAMLRDALDDRRMSLAFQPIVSLRGDAQPSYNVFVRMTDGDGVRHDAHDFIDIAERVGMAKEIDRFVLMHAAARLKPHLAEHPATRFFIKLSANTLGDPASLSKVFTDYAQLQVPADRIVIELRESVVLTHLKPAIEASRTLKALGSALCLAEFGNGLDPEKMLNLIQPRYVKLDPAQMERLSKQDESLLRWIQATHDLGAQFMVSHIEDADQLAEAFAASIDFAQGNFIQAPSDTIDFNFESF